MKESKWIKDIKENVQKYDIISFDIYDTLLKRDCQKPKDVFELVEYKYNKIYKKEVKEFAKKRYEAEVRVVKKGISVPNIDEIYDEISIDNENIKQRLKELEKKIEIEITIANKDILEVYKYAKKQGKEIIAVSDMYFDRETLKIILNKSGYDINEIWVSCEYRANKKSGKLFDIVLKNKKISSNSIMHIGDNKLADITGAGKQGIYAYYIPKDINNLSYHSVIKNDDMLSQNILNAFINNRVKYIDSRVTQIGYETLGPMVYGFCQWVHLKKKKHKFKKLLFCARDVFQTMNIYKKMYPEEIDEIEYMYISLKSLELPYLAAIGEDTSPQALEQLRLIRQYLKDIGCIGKVAMVDSGYGGHTQNMLMTILGDTCELHSLYMRKSKNFNKNVTDNESFAYMFEKKPSAESYICGGFFETMLSATHGRTLKYYEVSGKVVPVLGDDNPQKELLTEFQNGIYLFYDEWKMNVNKIGCIKGKYVERSFLNFAFYPIKEDVMLLGKVTGGNESYLSIVLDEDAKNYKKNMLNFIYGLKETYWKGGFITYYLNHPRLIIKIYLLIDKFILNIVGF